MQCIGLFIWVLSDVVSEVAGMTKFFPSLCVLVLLVNDSTAQHELRLSVGHPQFLHRFGAFLDLF